MLHKKMLWIVASLLLVFLLTACGGKDQAENTNEEVVATVNDQEILASEYNEVFSRMEMMYQSQGIDFSSEEGKKMVGMIEEQAMDEVINTTLLTQAAQKESFEATDAEVEQNIETMKSQFEDEAEFQSQIEAAGYTLERLEKEVRTSILIDKYLTANLPEVSVTEEEIKDMFSMYEQQSEEEINIEDYRSTIEEDLKYQKEQQEFVKIIDQLKADSEIEIIE